MANVPAFIQPLYNYPVGQAPFWSITKAGGPGNSANEGGIDIPNPAHTPVYSLGVGTLESCHLFWHNPPDVTVPSGGNPGYGVVTVRTMVPGFGLNDMYYQHIDLNPSIPVSLGGSNPVGIQKGQLLGWTRGDVGEVEVGCNPTGWGPEWGSEPHPGPWVNPESRIRALVDSDPNFAWGSATSSMTPAWLNGAWVNSLTQGIFNTPITDQLAPDASVADWLYGLDVALVLQNPFDVQNATQDTIGIGPASVSFTDPVAWLQVVGTNMVQDFSALTIRTLFVVIGLAIILGIGFQSQSQATDEALAPVGGKAGAAKLIAGLV